MRKKGVAVLFLFLLACLPFLPTLRAGFLNWDDDFYLTENPDIVSPIGWRNTLARFTTDANVYPLVFASFRMERRLWGMNPIGYHAVNVALHGLVAVSAFWLLVRLGVEQRAAWWVSLLFAVHPMQVATVAWVSERKSLLGTLFILWSWIAFVRPEESERKEGFHRYLYPGLSLVLALLGYLSKSSLVVFPFLLLLSQRLRGKRQGVWVWPHFFLAAGVGWVYAGRETGPDLTFLERAFLVPRSLLFYLGSWLFSSPGGGVYPKWDTAAVTAANTIACLGVSILLALAILLRRRIDTIGWLGLSLFIIPLAPSLGILSFGYQQHAFVSDHFAYWGLLGLSLCGVAVLYRIARLGSRFRTALLIAIAFVWSALSWAECRVWKSSEDFWEATLSQSPESWVAHQNLATELDRQGRAEEACAHYQEAVRIEPENPVGWINLGRSQIKDGSSEHAVVSLKRAIGLNPHYTEAYGFLAEALSRLGRYEEALEAKKKSKGE